MQFISLFEVQNQLCNISTHALYADLGLSWSGYCTYFWKHPDGTQTLDLLHGTWKNIAVSQLQLDVFLSVWGCMFDWPHWQEVGVSKNRGTPKWMVKIMENPIKMDDLGGNTPVFGNSQVWNSTLPLLRTFFLVLVNFPIFPWSSQWCTLLATPKTMSGYILPHNTHTPRHMQTLNQSKISPYFA